MDGPAAAEAAAAGPVAAVADGKLVEVEVEVVGQVVDGPAAVAVDGNQAAVDGKPEAVGADGPEEVVNYF